MTFEGFINKCASDCVNGTVEQPAPRPSNTCEHARTWVSGNDPYTGEVVRICSDCQHRVFKCCSPNCPSFTFRASERAHPADICTERKKPTRAERIRSYMEDSDMTRKEATAMVDFEDGKS